MIKSVSMKCEECKFDYPENLLAPITTSGESWGKICGICALEIGNRIHGIKLKRFTGPIAEKMRQAAIKWREEHPPDADA